METSSPHEEDQKWLAEGVTFAEKGLNFSAAEDFAPRPPLASGSWGHAPRPLLQGRREVTSGPGTKNFHGPLSKQTDCRQWRSQHFCKREGNAPKIFCQMLWCRQIRWGLGANSPATWKFRHFSSKITPFDDYFWLNSSTNWFKFDWKYS